MLVRVLIAVSAEPTSRRVRSLLGRNRVASVAMADPGRLWAELGSQPFDVLVTTRGELPGEPAAAVSAIRRLAGSPDVVVLEPAGASGSNGRAELLSAGCVAVVDPTLPNSLLAETLDLLLRRRRDGVLSRLSLSAAAAPCAFADFISEAPAMRELVALARAASSYDSNVLILGETGAGKERMARAMHAEGPRASRPFIAINSGAVTETLAESELFGHEKGSFTGALRTRRGLFELAHRGTLFFDEISEMRPGLQVKLLRALEDGSMRRVGGEEPVRLDVRVIAATHRDLREEVRMGRFREDLYYRLAVVSLCLPPLRARRGDLPGLIGSCLGSVSRRLGRCAPGISSDAAAALRSYDWPGNVRELLNVLERAVLLCNGTIGIRELPREIVSRAEPLPAGAAGDDTHRDLWWHGRPLLEARRSMVAEFERAYLTHLLQQCNGRAGEAARLAGISTRSLSDMLKRHQLNRHSFCR